MQPDIIVVSIIFSIIVFYLTGFSPGGIIAPIYFAMYFNNVPLVMGTLSLSLLVYYLIKISQRHFIIYGRQRFALAVVFGVLIQWGVASFFPVFPLGFIGFIIPGIVANEFHRQGIVISIFLLLISSGVLFLFFGGLGLGGFSW